MNPLTPTQGNERIVPLDILRGIAIFGILLLNMEGFSQPLLYLNLTGDVLWTDPWNTAVSAVITILGEGKFYSAFSFLFGLGAYIFLSRIEAKGLNPTGLYIRRMTVLLAFGLLHAFLLW